MLLLLAPVAAAHVPFPRGTTTITEVHAGPAADGGQWFELRNNATNGQNLVEQVFTDADGDTFEIAVTVIVRAGEYAVFASAESPVDRHVTLPEGFDLRPDAGAVVHTDLLGVVDEVVWDAAWGLSATSAHQLDVGVAANEWANDRPANWCAGLGSPGVANERCPGADTDDDADGYTELDGDCDDRDATVFPGAVDRPDVANDGDCDGTRDEDPVEDAGAPVDTGETGDTGAHHDTDTADTADTDTDTDPGETDTAETDTDPADTGTPHTDVDPDGCARGCGGGAAWLVLLGLGARRRPAR